MHLRQMKKRYLRWATPTPFFLFPFILLLTLLLALPWVSAKEPPKPKPEAWQINGIVAALDDGHDEVKKLAFEKFNGYDLKNLKWVVQKPEDIALKAAKILKDKTVDSIVRAGAASALGNLGEAAKPYVKDILDILKDKTVDKDVRYSAAEALGKIEQLNLNNIVVILDSIYYAGQSEFAQWRFLTYFLGGGTDEVKTLLTWLGFPDTKTIPISLSHDQGDYGFLFGAELSRRER